MFTSGPKTYHIYETSRAGRQKRERRMDINWKHIITTYQEPLYWHIRRMVVSHDDASDLLQEVFIQAFNNIGQLKNPKAIKAWLYRIATNKCLRHLETQKDNQTSLDQTPEAKLDHLQADEYINYDKEILIRFQKALQSLSPQQRVVFTLRYYDDLSYDEISEITGTKKDVLKASWYNAKKKVKEYLLTE